MSILDSMMDRRRQEESEEDAVGLLVARAAFLKKTIKHQRQPSSSMVQALIDAGNELYLRGKYKEAAESMGAAGQKLGPGSMQGEELATRWTRNLYKGTTPNPEWDSIVAGVIRDAPDNSAFKREAERIWALRKHNSDVDPGALVKQPDQRSITIEPLVPEAAPSLSASAQEATFASLRRASFSAGERAAAVRNRIKKHGVSFTVGLGTGFAARQIVHGVASLFVAAKVITVPAILVSAPPFAVTLAAGVVLGAAAGGLGNVGKTWMLTKKEERQKGWAGRAFVKGLLPGAIGGFIGANLGDLFHADGFWRGLFNHSHAPTSGAVNLVPTPVSHAPTSVQAPLVPLGTMHVASLPPATVGAPMPIHAVPAAASLSPHDQILAGNEEAVKLMNAHQYAKAGEVMRHTIDIAKQSGIDNSAVKETYANMSFWEMWRNGTGHSHIGKAVEYSRHAGSTVHHYAHRLMKLPSVMRYLKTAPAPV